MRGSLVHRPANQLKLFHPPRKTPPWQTLPLEVRQRAIKLLALLLRQNVAERGVADPAQEASNE